MDRTEAIGVLTIEQASHRKDGLVDRAIDMAIAALREQEQSKWISVKERLPEDDVEVLTRRATGMSVETHHSFGWAYDAYNGKWEITHWRPLPEPPEGGAE